MPSPTKGAGIQTRSPLNSFKEQYEYARTSELLGWYKATTWCSVQNAWQPCFFRWQSGKTGCAVHTSLYGFDCVLFLPSYFIIDHDQHFWTTMMWNEMCKGFYSCLCVFGHLFCNWFIIFSNFCNIYLRPSAAFSTSALMRPATAVRRYAFPCHPTPHSQSVLCTFPAVLLWIFITQP